MNDHPNKSQPKMFAEDGFSISDYVDNPDDPQEIAIQLCSMLSSAGTSVNENGDFVMDAAQVKPFAALLHQNRLLANKKRKYYKRRAKRFLDQIPEEDIEHMVSSENRGTRNRFGLGSTLRAKVLVVENSLPASELPPPPSTTNDTDAEAAFNIGDVVLTESSQADSYVPGEIFDPEAAPPIVRVLKPEEGESYLVAVYPHGGLEWFAPSKLRRTDSEMLKRFETLSTDGAAKAAFRIAQDPAKWRDTFTAALQVMVEARRATDIEHDDAPKVREESHPADDKEAADGGEDDGGDADDGGNYEDLQPSRHLRSHAHLLGPDRYEVGELVLGKLKGHPFWPGRIADRHKLPRSIAEACPDRDDQDIYPIRFYPEGDYWWVPHSNIMRLDQERIAKFIRETRSNFGPLLDGYKIARDSAKWEEENAPKAEDDIVDLYEIELPEKPKPKEPTPKPSHKRKRGQSGRDESGTPQPHKRRKRGDGDGRRKSQARSEDTEGDRTMKQEEETGSAPAVSPRTAAAEEAQQRMGKLLKMRWLLQKTFLNGEKPNDARFPDASRVMDELQKDTEPTGLMLRETKIQKVLMGISKMDFIRSDEEFHFRARARAILKSWEHIPIPPHPNATGRIMSEQARNRDGSTPVRSFPSPLTIVTQLPARGDSMARDRASLPRATEAENGTPAMPLTALPSGMDDPVSAGAIPGINGSAPPAGAAEHD